VSLLGQPLARIYKLSQAIVEPDLRIVAAHVGENRIEITITIHITQANLGSFGVPKSLRDAL
jgi:hypothetical protein